jgi:hypothetical protein
VGEATPDDTTLVVFRRRLGKKRMESFFKRINEQVRSKGLLRRARKKALRVIRKRYPILRFRS